MVGDPNNPDCESVETLLVYDQLEDFEEYEICEDGSGDYGRRLGLEG